MLPLTSNLLVVKMSLICKIPSYIHIACIIERNGRRTFIKAPSCRFHPYQIANWIVFCDKDILTTLTHQSLVLQGQGMGKLPCHVYVTMDIYSNTSAITCSLILSRSSPEPRG